jgi:hypothetical protein
MVICVASIRQRDLVAQFDVDALSLVPWRKLDSGTLPTSRLVLLAALTAAAVALSTRRRWVVPLTVALALLVALPRPQVTVDRDATRRFSWVDQAAGRDQHALVVTAGIPDRTCDRRALEELALWTEFFNVSATDAAHLFRDNAVANLRSRKLTIAADGTLLDRGRPLRARWIVIDSRFRLAGTQVSSLPAGPPGDLRRSDVGLTLWHVPTVARLVDSRKVIDLAGRACSV